MQSLMLFWMLLNIVWKIVLHLIGWFGFTFDLYKCVGTDLYQNMTSSQVFFVFGALPSKLLVTRRHTFEKPPQPQRYHLNFKWNLKLDSVVARFGEYSSFRLYLTTYLTTTISPLWSVSVFLEHFLNQSHLGILYSSCFCLFTKQIDRYCIEEESWLWRGRRRS